jgi:hypothetical protein
MTPAVPRFSTVNEVALRDVVAELQAGRSRVRRERYAGSIPAASIHQLLPERDSLAPGQTIDDE